MVVDLSSKKLNEQYPLLMVSGSGDATVRNPPPVVDSLPWNPRRPWTERWPEYISSCWMTIILLGISFLIFYAISMVVIYRQEQYLFNKDENKPANKVYFHNLIPRGGEFPFSKYKDYLGYVATQYINLNFNVYFLIDDSRPRYFFTYLFPSIRREYSKFNKMEVQYFQNKYPNVFIHVMPLSKYIITAPLKFRWENIPTPYIPFYARTYAVWLNGGLGIDLDVQNRQFHSQKPIGDGKVQALLKQHNDGISPEKYVETLNKLEREEELECFSSIAEMFQKMFFETVAMFNNTLPYNLFTDKKAINPVTPVISESKSLIRTHRNKREVIVEDNENKINSTHPALANIAMTNLTDVNVTFDSGKQFIYHIDENEANGISNNINKTSEPIVAMGVNRFMTPSESSNETETPKNIEISSVAAENKSHEHVVFIYDFSVISSDSGRLENSKSIFGNPLKIITIDTEGSIIVSTSRLHPFLKAVLTGSWNQMSPKCAIKNALLSQCSGPYRDEIYCKSIFVL